MSAADAGNSVADADAMGARLLDLISAVTCDLHRGRPAPAHVTLDASLERDFALDSLARVELGARIEREFTRAVPETLLFEASTPRELLHAVLKAGGATPARVGTTRDAVAAAVDITLPQAALTLPEVLAWHADRTPARAHIEFYDDYGSGLTLTYDDLWQAARAVAHGLCERGVTPGERIALMLPTGRDYFCAFYGALMCGAIPVPIYPPVRRAQLEEHLRRQSRILASAACTWLIAGEDTTLVARLLTATVASLRGVVTVGELEAQASTFVALPVRSDDIAFIQYTSGSTGDPKGVVLSHDNLLANIRADGAALAATPADVFVSWLPLYHDMGLIGAWLGSLYHGVRLVVMSPLTFLARPERWLWAIHRHRGTLSAAPNFAYELCAKRIDDAQLDGLDLSSWRLALNGAEAISATTVDAFCTRFASYGFRRQAMLPVYGLAECAVGLCFSPRERGLRIDRIDRDRLAQDGIAEPSAVEPLREVVACGLPLPGHQIRVVDERDRELPERHEGRVQFRGPSATRGYFNQPGASADLMRDGWLQTGDRGYIAAGELHITGRSKDIVIRAGRNIYPTELEDAVGDLDGIRRGHVAVFGVTDPTQGTERLVVLAETRKRGEAARTALRDAINRLASELVAGPADDIVLAPPNTVLRTSSGKIRRAACRALYESGHSGARERALWLQVTRLALLAFVPQWRRALRQARALAFAAWSWFVFVILAASAWLAAWLPVPRAATWGYARACARLLGRLTLTPITCDGAAGLATPGARVIVANHQSYLDGMLIMALRERPARFLVKGELARSRLLATPLRRLGVVFVDRFDAVAGLNALQGARDALAAGDTLVVFAEGTFKRMPGVLPFHLGAFALAADAEVPVIALAVHGTRSILRAGSWFPRHAAIKVVCSGPLAVTAADTSWARAIALRDAARGHILEHAGEPDLAHESNAVDDTR